MARPDSRIDDAFTANRVVLRSAEALLAFVASAHVDGAPSVVGEPAELSLALEGIRHLVKVATDRLEKSLDPSVGRG